MSESVHFTIDGRAITVAKGTTVYEAAKQHGIDIPIFCYHDRMPPFGACRMCLVEVEKMAKPQTSCTLEVTEGMVVHTKSQTANDAQEGILELLLINHPLDCPICDRGGECPLQDQTLKHGPGKSRFYEEKRHFKKPLSLGPVLTLDRERCIVCARCTRFGDIIAGDHALEFIERGYRTEVGTAHGGPAESKFIGNTIQICPVGALTSEVYRFRARPWDNDSTYSTCTLCPVGCSMILDARDGEIMRTRSHANREVNDVWLCDKGWFGYEFTSHLNRLQHPLVRREGTLEKASWEEALTFVANKMKEAIPSGKLAAIGGNPLTTEENDLFQKLMRDVAKVNHIDHRVGEPLFTLDEEEVSPGMEISIGECENLSFVILFGLDLTEEFPLIWLRLRQAINKGAKVIFFGHYAPEITPYMTELFIHSPGLELETFSQQFSVLEKCFKERAAFFVGRQYLAHPHRKKILKEIQKYRQKIPGTSLNLLEGRGNSIGARIAGMRPDLGSFGKRLSNPGLNTLQIIQEAALNGWDFLYVVGTNPFNKFPSKLWTEAREKLKFLVVQDLFITETAKCADVVLPTLSFVEKEGTFMNIEGRAQHLHPGKLIPDNLYSDAEIFKRLAEKLDYHLIIEDHFKKLHPPIEKFQHEQSEENYSRDLFTIPDGKFAATFVHALFDRGIRMQHNPHLVQLAKEPYVRIHPLEGVKREIQDGDRVHLNSKDGSILAKVKFDKGVADRTIVVPLGFPELPVHELGANLLNGLTVEIEK